MGPYDGVESDSPYLRESAFYPLLSLNTHGWDGMGWGRFLRLIGDSVADPCFGFRDP
jgi:hypothetical protein